MSESKAAPGGSGAGPAGLAYLVTDEDSATHAGGSDSGARNSGGGGDDGTAKATTSMLTPTEADPPHTVLNVQVASAGDAAFEDLGAAGSGPESPEARGTWTSPLSLHRDRDDGGHSAARATPPRVPVSDADSEPGPLSDATGAERRSHRESVLSDEEKAVVSMGAARMLSKTKRGATGVLATLAASPSPGTLTRRQTLGSLAFSKSARFAEAARLAKKGIEVQKKEARQRLYRLVVLGRATDGLERKWRMGLIATIFIGTLSVQMETVLWNSDGLESLKLLCVTVIEIIVVSVYILEYAVRVWVCNVDKDFDNDRPVYGRWLFARAKVNLLDAAFILVILMLPVIGSAAYFGPYAANAGFLVESVRVWRGLRMVKIGRYSPSVQLLFRVVQRKGDELVSTAMICGTLVILLSLFVFTAEHRVNGAEFTNMGTALWWGIVTLSTVGYGDMAPVTNTGRLLGSLGAVLGIALFTLPAGIIASGFLDMKASEQEVRARVLKSARGRIIKGKLKVGWDRWRQKVVLIRAAEAEAFRLRHASAAGDIDHAVPFLQVVASELLREASGEMDVALRALMAAFDVMGETPGTSHPHNVSTSVGRHARHVDHGTHARGRDDDRRSHSRRRDRDHSKHGDDRDRDRQRERHHRHRSKLEDGGRGRHDRNQSADSASDNKVSGAGLGASASGPAGRSPSAPKADRAPRSGQSRGSSPRDARGGVVVGHYAQRAPGAGSLLEKIENKRKRERVRRRSNAGT